jgi:ketosteroid isomerase-like protein
MSQENVESARRAMDAFNRGEWETTLEWCDPAIEWVVAREHPNTRTLHGRAEVRAYWEEWRETVGTFTFEISEFLPAGDQVLLAGRMRGRGTASGAELEVPLALVATMRDGHTVHLHEYLDRREALGAAGLSEPR